MADFKSGPTADIDAEFLADLSRDTQAGGLSYTCIQLVSVSTATASAFAAGPGAASTPTVRKPRGPALNLHN